MKQQLKTLDSRKWSGLWKTGMTWVCPDGSAHRLSASRKGHGAVRVYRQGALPSQDKQPGGPRRPEQAEARGQKWTQNRTDSGGPAQQPPRTTSTPWGIYHTEERWEQWRRSTGLCTVPDSSRCAESLVICGCYRRAWGSCFRGNDRKQLDEHCSDFSLTNFKRTPPKIKLFWQI